MTALRSRELISVEDYLEGEQLSEIKHEYFNGQVSAMAGTTAMHNLLCLNLALALRQHLASGPCKVFVADVKVKCRFLEQDVFYYPDVMVACDPTDNHPLYRERPKLLIEVLSGDESKERREKYFLYRSLPSLEEYALIGQDPAAPEVSIFRRATGWEKPIVLREGEVELSSVGLCLPLAEIFRV